MNIGTHTIAAGNSFAGMAHGRFAVPIEELELRHLTTRHEIEQILHLRENIDLSVHTAAGGDFESLEKKETSAVSSEPSSFAAHSSARSGSYQWIEA